MKNYIAYCIAIIEIVVISYYHHRYNEDTNSAQFKPTSIVTDNNSVGIVDIPVIDVSAIVEFEEAMPKDRHVLYSDYMQTVLAIDSALASEGIFIMTNHGIATTVIDRSFESSKNLFSLSLNDKEQTTMNTASGIGRGYLPFGAEAGVRTFFESKEGFSYGRNTVDIESIDENQLKQVNRWPESFSSYNRQSMNHIFDHSARLARYLSNSVLEALNHYKSKSEFLSKEDLDFLKDNHHGADISIMRLFHYIPPTEELLNSYDVLGSSPHTDWGLLTLIYEHGCSSLQFLRNGKWHTVESTKVTSSSSQAIIVNGGDYLSLISGGRYKSPIHRVISDQKIERLSHVFFYYPPYDAMMPKLNSSQAKLYATNGDNSYNTLLATNSQADTNNFGDYIINKWLGVQRSRNN